MSTDQGGSRSEGERQIWKQPFAGANDIESELVEREFLEK